MPLPTLNESERLRALRELDILDSAPEREFDALAQAAAAVCDVPVALVTLVDAHRVWLKARVGPVQLCELPRGQSVCNHTIEQGGLLEVEDTAADERFARLPPSTPARGCAFTPDCRWSLTAASAWACCACWTSARAA
ncbi:hypothetical protein [Azohydromonas lata]|uniref:GAF domain-containing protein n=1 Tax=Azohydromonas lata TaxID=45677 RepID=A0ABU5IRF2_9BURK|nr:hypothetical protein [Azohydromonas lata]MDZ5461461.1 hypothetical protein [Azohydromonas lata]